MTASRTLDGRVALVTGGGNGIGERSAITLAASGARVVIVDIDAENGGRVVDFIESGGGSAVLVNENCAEPDSVRAIIEATAQRFGRLDILDNNAAALDLTVRDKSVVETEYEVFVETLRRNVAGTFLMCRQAIPLMQRHGGGRIINIASVSGMLGESTLTAYGVSKAAVIQLTRMVATQYGAAGIRCNAISPSYVTTRNNATYAPKYLQEVYRRSTPSGQLDTPQDIADLVAFLASDAAAQINGQIIAVDGGLAGASPIVPDFVDAAV